jgi:hypothetical protein
MCEVPFAEAPDLFGACQGPRGYPHCYVKRQPQTPAELNQMVGAIRCAELQCIRYRGTDKVILDRLVKAGEVAICDGLPLGSERGGEEQQTGRANDGSSSFSAVPA